MHNAFDQIETKINQAEDKNEFLEILFGKWKEEVLDGKQIVLFGAGGLGKELFDTLHFYGINGAFFCDNNEKRIGQTFCDIEIISFDDLLSNYNESLVIIASQKYSHQLYEQLINNGFDKTKILCKPDDSETNILYMFAMVGTQNLLKEYRIEYKDNTLLNFLYENKEDIQKAFELFADQKSKELFISKLAFVGSNGNYSLFKNFIKNFSEPLLRFGKLDYDGTPEDHFYFNNDVFILNDDEVYLDVGAYDGDTVQTFLEACRENKLNYKSIEAFEPDPICFDKLKNNTSSVKNLNCYCLGIWSESTTLNFITSENTVHDQAAVITEEGNTTIKVVSIDDFLHGKKATLIKMDPGGNIIPQILRGAENTINRYKPNLVMGAYHGIKSIFEIPILLNSILPEYKLYLRHNTYHLCDTDLYATIN